MLDSLNQLAFVLRLFFHLLYNPFAWSYDWVAAIVSHGHWVEWTHATLPFLSGDRILELGHGPGHLQVSLNQRGWEVIGLDRSPAMGRLAQRRLRKASLPDRLVKAEAQSLPFATGAFDQIVATFPTEYLFQSQTLAEIRRVLRPAGLLVVLPVAWIGKRSRLDRGLEKVYRITHQAPDKTDARWSDSMVEIFQRAGFSTRSEKITLGSSEIYLLLASV